MSAKTEQDLQQKAAELREAARAERLSNRVYHAMAADQLERQTDPALIKVPRWITVAVSAAIAAGAIAVVLLFAQVIHL